MERKLSCIPKGAFVFHSCISCGGNIEYYTEKITVQKSPISNKGAVLDAVTMRKREMNMGYVICTDCGKRYDEGKDFCVYKVRGHRPYLLLPANGYKVEADFNPIFGAYFTVIKE